jgi:flavin-dependent dehydrogenase
MSAIIKAKILGAGVAGSLLAYRLPYSTVYEMFPGFRKPCGEAIPNETPQAPFLHHYLSREIHAIHVCVRYECRIHDFGETVGWIIRKHEWLDILREKIGYYARIKYSVPRLSKNFIDARGAYSDSPEYDSLITARGFTDDFGGFEDTLYFYYHPGFLGYLWVFPASETGMWNVGVGMRSKDYKKIGKPIWKLLEELAADLALITRITNIQAMKIKIVDPSNAIDKDRNIVRIGEAGGFIVPFTGEGIRPAIESAMALAEDILNHEYSFPRLQMLASRYKRHHKIYRLLLRLGSERAARLMLKFSSEDFRRLMSGEINIFLKLRMLAGFVKSWL